MKIVHLSDWHGETKRIPPADLYVVSGDMLPNFPLIKIQTIRRSNGGIAIHDPHAHANGKGLPPPNGYYAGRILEPKREETLQREWIAEHPFRSLLGIRDDVPVVCVRGNHDFTDLSEWFGGNVWEVNLDSSRTTSLFGMKIGGVRGISYIAGEWSDEMSRAEFVEACASLPNDLDLLITHSPPDGILDEYCGNHCGSRALTAYITSRLHTPWIPFRAHFFGHVHESRGESKIQGVVFSNASTNCNIIEL